MITKLILDYDIPIAGHVQLLGAEGDGDHAQLLVAQQRPLRV